MASSPDRFFTEPQQRWLEDLMAKWRHARDAGRALSPEDQAELDGVVGAEFHAAAERAAAIGRDLVP